ncbi:hypothetical protein SBA6_420006 [Candidatus Sulfopaludibacter sp. SbA6]|nr:hypothetical protein SBA6_420006 [Candidatus Sulfopaludibacter sp. SbA6]
MLQQPALIWILMRRPPETEGAAFVFGQELPSERRGSRGLNRSVPENRFAKAAYTIFQSFTNRRLARTPWHAGCNP